MNVFSILFWGSDPALSKPEPGFEDEDYDEDCWKGRDYATEAAARAAFVEAVTVGGSFEVAYVELVGPGGISEVGRNPKFDAARVERERGRDEDAVWRREIAMEAGMAFGVDGYNDAMGY